MIFKPASRYPVDPRAVFMLAFSIFVGATALAVDAAPDTLNYLLPKWAVFLWGILLVGGSAITLGGMVFQSVGGIITEQIGSVMIAATTLFYSILAIWLVGAGAIQPVGIIGAWGLACAVRWLQLQVLITQTYHEQIRRDTIRSHGGDPNDPDDPEYRP